jgi:hypothetical protein
MSTVIIPKQMRGGSNNPLLTIYYPVGDYYCTWIVFGAYYVAFRGLLLYLDSFRRLLRCFLGLITVPG